jgi:hypothetical protein
MLALTSISPAYAVPPVPVSGSFTFTLTGITSEITHGGSTIVKFTFYEQLTGSIVGTRSGTGIQISQADGAFSVKNCGVFVGKVLGIPGTADDCATLQGFGNSFAGEFATAHGTGGLTGSQVTASFVGASTGPTTTAGTYSGEFVLGV